MTTTRIPRSRTPEVTCQEVLLHGHRVRYRQAGDGKDVIVLVHGIFGFGQLKLAGVGVADVMG